MNPRKSRDPPSVTILNEILKAKAKLDEDLERKNNADLQSFHDGFIAEMKKRDKLFDSLYQCTYYAGSYYSDLRISAPDEYDLDLLLKLPFKEEDISVEYQPQVPSYVKYKIRNETTIGRYDGLNTLFENGFLIPDQMRSWMQSVVDKALETYRRPGRFAEIKCSASGPARTITLVKNDATEIDIDLVPVIECSMNARPPGIDRRVHEKYLRNSQISNTGNRASSSAVVRRRPAIVESRCAVECFLVPKPHTPSKQAPLSDTERSRLWKAHYPKAEHFIIHDLGCVKPLIRLLKLLRDQENWKILASYHMKTVVMWMILENPGEENWNPRHFGEKFLDALKNLQSYVERRYIPFFFSSSCNLLEKLSVEQATNIGNRLRFIIRDIERDHNKLWDVFDCTPTVQVG